MISKVQAMILMKRLSGIRFERLNLLLLAGIELYGLHHGGEDDDTTSMIVV